MSTFTELTETYTGLHWLNATDPIAYFAYLEDITFTRIVDGATLYYVVYYDKTKVQDLTVDDGPRTWQQLLAAVTS